MKVQNICNASVSGYKQNTKTNNVSSVPNTQIKSLNFGMEPIPPKYLQRGGEILSEAARLLALSKQSPKPIFDNGSVLQFEVFGGLSINKMGRTCSELFSYVGETLRQCIRTGDRVSEVFSFNGGKLAIVTTQNPGEEFKMYSA
jgi:hypothetical protein